MKKSPIKSFGSSSKGNSILVGGLLMDAGVSPDKINPKPKAVFITHRHGDHSRYINQWLKRGTRCYGGEIASSAFGRVIDVNDVVEIDKYKVTAVPALHDTEKTLNFVVEFDDYKVLYEVDNAKRVYRINGVTHYIAECNWDEATLRENIETGRVMEFEEVRLRSTHKSLEILLEELAEMDRSKLEEIWLAHTSDRNLNRRLAKATVQELTGVPVYFANER